MAEIVLIADDSTTVRRVVEQSLEDEGIQVIAVADGDEALARIREVPPDLVLADVLMPGRSGYELAEEITADQSLSGLPVILLSGAFEPFDEERARRCGAIGHLTKPFQSSLLVERVRAALEQDRSGPARREGRDDDLLGAFHLRESGDPSGAQMPALPASRPGEDPLDLDEDERETAEDDVATQRIDVPLPGEDGFEVVPRAAPPAAAGAAGAAESVDPAVLREEIRRKVDELAPDIVREVAWEIVPDLLERLLRETAELPAWRPGPTDSGDSRK